MRRLARLAAPGLLLLLALPSSAVIIFDTIGPTGVTTGGAGVFVGTVSGDGVNYERAASFVVPGSEDFVATGLDLLMDDGGNTIRLWTDAGGEPGTLLDAATPPASAVVDDLFAATLGGGAVLEAGQTYWISVARPSGSSAWRYTSTGPYASGNRMNREDGGPWQDSSPRAGQLYGFTVHGLAVPEPGVLLLLGLGLAGLARRRLAAR